MENIETGVVREVASPWGREEKPKEQEDYGTVMLKGRTGRMIFGTAGSDSQSSQQMRDMFVNGASYTTTSIGINGVTMNNIDSTHFMITDWV